MEDVQVLKPTIFLGVPRILLKVYDKIQAGISQLTGVKRWLLETAINSKMETLQTTGVHTHWFYDKVVFAKFS